MNTRPFGSRALARALAALSFVTLLGSLAGCSKKAEEAPPAASGSTYYEGKMQKPAQKGGPGGGGAMRDL